MSTRLVLMRVIMVVGAVFCICMMALGVTFIVKMVTEAKQVIHLTKENNRIMNELSASCKGVQDVPNKK